MACTPIAYIMHTTNAFKLWKGYTRSFLDKYKD